MKLELDLPPNPTPHQIMAAVAMADADPWRRWEVVGDALRVQPSPVNRHGDAQLMIAGVMKSHYRRFAVRPDEGWVVIPFYPRGIAPVSRATGVAHDRLTPRGKWP